MNRIWTYTNQARGVLSVLCVVALMVFLHTASPVECGACSVFSLSTGDESIMGQNLDYEHFPGQVVVNKRGVRKTILAWRGHWPDTKKRDTVSWVSRYGSVTFTCYGRDFIEGGMNEVGLMVDEANLTAAYPPDDGRPGVSCPQWMQYQLDNYATVGEVLEHLGDLRPDGEGWHYLVADRGGACAVIEYHNGEAVVYTGDAVEVCAITNTSHRQALSHIPMDKAFGGDIDIAAGSDSYGRFVHMAARIRDYDPERSGNIIGYAFLVLEDVRVDNTIRSVVYDATYGRVFWLTPGNPQMRWLNLNALDFSKGTPAQVLDVEAGTGGDVSGLLVDYTVEENRALIAAVLGSDANNPKIAKKLKSRGLTFEDALDLIAEHPTAGMR